MNMKKKLTALALALALATSLGSVAFAAPATGSVTDNRDGTQNVTGLNDDVNGFEQGGDGEWKAEIVTGDVISVVMPTSVDFYLKLKGGVYTPASGGTQMGFDRILSAEAKVVNNSTCAIELSCVAITDGGVASSANPSAGATLPSGVLSLVELALAPQNSDASLTDQEFTEGKLDPTAVGSSPLAFGTIATADAADPNANIYSLWMHGRKLAGETEDTWKNVMLAINANETVTATVTTTFKVAVTP